MRWIIAVCHFLELLSLAVWVGGMLIIGALVAPVAFSNLQIGPAGDMMARIFHNFNGVVTISLVIILIASFLARLLTEQKLKIMTPRRLRMLEGVFLLLFCVSALYVGAVLTPRAEIARANLHQKGPGGTAEEFGRLHRRSEELATVGLLAGLGLFFVKGRALSLGQRKGEGEGNA
jgi:uncharacterized membrane protein